MTLGLISFVKTVGAVALVAVLTYLSSTANLTGIVPAGIATIIAGLASAFETYLKQQSGNTTALFGAVNVK